MTTDQPSGQPDFEQPSVDLIQRIAQLTRTLRVSMRELGLDQAIKDAAARAIHRSRHTKGNHTGFLGVVEGDIAVISAPCDAVIE